MTTIKSFARMHVRNAAAQGQILPKLSQCRQGRVGHGMEGAIYGSVVVAKLALASPNDTRNGHRFCDCQDVHENRSYQPGPHQPKQVASSRAKMATSFFRMVYSERCEIIVVVRRDG